MLTLPYHLVELTVIAVDMTIAVAITLLTGVGYNWFFLGSYRRHRRILPLAYSLLPTGRLSWPPRGAYRVTFRNHVRAQANGYRGETPTTDLMSKRVELDRWYIPNWSIWLDIAILFRTLIVGLQPAAY
jgi:hypothetical protein